MTRRNFKHVRHEARKHEKRHLYLKDLLSKEILKEKLLSIFVSTFLIVISTVVIFLNWGKITGWFDQPAVQPPGSIEAVSQVHGFRTGTLAIYQINGQTADQYIRFLQAIGTEGYRSGVRTVSVFGSHVEAVVAARKNTFLAAITVNNDLSKGKHLSALDAKHARSLQKSILATIYLGRKTVDIYSSVQTDAQLLSQIKNTLEVDLFAYLNQSADRANALDNFLRLIDALMAKAQSRSTDL